jgi:sulfur carrier protein ThiS
MLERCACAVGEDIIPRQTALTQDSILVLLSPVAGG